jgi:hypothetical protein
VVDSSSDRDSKSPHLFEGSATRPSAGDVQVFHRDSQGPASADPSPTEVSDWTGATSSVENAAALPVSLHSGVEWVEDPQGNANSHDGRTIRRDMRSKRDQSRLALVKRPKPEYVDSEMYAIGMERVAYTLGSTLDLPIPETWLDNVEGHPSSVQRRIPDARSWRMMEGGVPQLRNIRNTEVYPLGALFDVWMANTDRRDVNLLLEALPPGTPPGRARESQVWLIDHGCCGLWPANKFDLGRAPAAIIEDATEVHPELHERTESAIGAVMPPEYRMSLKHTQGDDRTQILDRIRGIDDDAIDRAVGEIPEEYISAPRAQATVAFLKARRDALSTVTHKHWM